VSTPRKEIDTLIAAGTLVQGDIGFNGALHIDGTVEGNVAARTEGPATLTISHQGRVKGTVDAAHLHIDGTVEGNVISTATLVIEANARIAGDVHYKSIVMHPGAVINGHLACAPDKELGPRTRQGGG